MSFNSVFYIENTELNNWRNIIRLGKSEVSVERISVCYVTENMPEHGKQCLACCHTNDATDILP